MSQLHDYKLHTNIGGLPEYTENTRSCTSVTFGVVIYSRAGSLIPIRLWVFTCVSYVVIATRAEERELCVLPSGGRVVSGLS